jgi:translation initiation factor IF-1
MEITTVGGNRRIHSTGYCILGAALLLPLLASPRAALAQSVNGAGWQQPGSAAQSRYSGVVTKRFNETQFALRTDDGHLIFVDTHGNGAAGHPGDTVSVTGCFDDHTLVASDLNFISYANNPNGTLAAGSQYVRINGTMTQSLRHDDFEMRSNSGAIVVVRAEGLRPPHLKVGDQIEISGQLTADNTVVADHVEIVFDKHGRYFINFPGTVSEIINGHHFKVLGDNGRDFLIETKDRLDHRMHGGDRVRVVGDFDGKTILATEVHTLDAFSSTSVHEFIFHGTVINVFPDNLMQVRSQHGDMYSVHLSGAGYFAVGQKIRVVGTLNNGTVLASKATND